MARDITPILQSIDGALADLQGRVAALETAASSPESLQPNYLTVNPNGTVSLYGITFDPNTGVATFTGNVDGGTVDAGSVNTDSVISLNGGADAMSIEGAGGVIVQAAGGSYLWAAPTGAYALAQGAGQRTLLDLSGNSSFAQWRTAGPVQIYLGSFTNEVAGPGAQAFTINLPFTWPTNHVAFLAWMSAADNWNPLSQIGSFPISTSQGDVLINNASGGNVTGIGFTYLSFGL